MLVIRRREGEAILLGGGVEVAVLEVAASRVKLGIIAPADVPVTRKEVWLAEQQNKASVASPLDARLDAGLSDWAERLRRQDPRPRD